VTLREQNQCRRFVRRFTWYLDYLWDSAALIEASKTGFQGVY